MVMGANGTPPRPTVGYALGRHTPRPPCIRVAVVMGAGCRVRRRQKEGAPWKLVVAHVILWRGDGQRRGRMLRGIREPDRVRARHSDLSDAQTSPPTLSLRPTQREVRRWRRVKVAQTAMHARLWRCLLVRWVEPESRVDL